MNLIESLKSKYQNDGPERVGFVLENNEVVEVKNVCPEPEEGFEVSGADIKRYAFVAVATWHTHPNDDFNLSPKDYEMFRDWPELAHYIVGNNGVRKYVVAEEEVLIAP